VAVAMPALALLGVFAEGLRGAGRVGVSQLVLQVLPPGVTIALYAVLRVLIGPVLGTALVAWATAAWIAALVAGIAFLRVFRPSWRGVLSSSSDGGLDRRGLWKLSFPLLGTALAGMGFAWSDVLVLGLFLDADAVGLYTMAARTAAPLGFPINAAAVVLGPLAARCAVRADWERLQDRVETVSRFLVLATLPGLLLLTVFARDALFPWFPGLRPAESILWVLAAGWFANAAVGCAGHLLSFCGQQSYHGRWALGAAFGAVAVNAMLVPLLGALGAAFGTMGSIAVMNLALVRGVRGRLGLRAHASVRILRPLGCAMAAVLVWLPAQLVGRGGWGVVAGLAVGFGVVLRWGLVAEDREFLQGILGRRLAGAGAS